MWETSLLPWIRALNWHLFCSVKLFSFLSIVSTENNSSTLHIETNLFSMRTGAVDQGTCLIADPLLIWTHPYRQQFTHTDCPVRFQFSVRYSLCVWIVVHRGGSRFKVDQQLNTSLDIDQSIHTFSHYLFSLIWCRKRCLPSLLPISWFYWSILIIPNPLLRLVTCSSSPNPTLK